MYNKTADIKRNTHASDGQGGYVDSAVTIYSSVPVRIRELTTREMTAQDQLYKSVTHRAYMPPDTNVLRKDTLVIDTRDFRVEHVNPLSEYHHLEIDCAYIERGV